MAAIAHNPPLQTLLTRYIELTGLPSHTEFHRGREIRVRPVEQQRESPELARKIFVQLSNELQKEIRSFVGHSFDAEFKETSSVGMIATVVVMAVFYQLYPEPAMLTTFCAMCIIAHRMDSKVEFLKRRDHIVLALASTTEPVKEDIQESVKQYEATEAAWRASPEYKAYLDQLYDY